MEDTERLIRILGDLRFYTFAAGKTDQKRSDAVHSSAHSSDAR